MQTTHRLEFTNDTCCPLQCIPKKCELKRKPAVNITVDGCVSVEKHVVEYCEGECEPSKHQVNYATSTLAQAECRCCSASVSRLDQIDLKCPDGSLRVHSIPILLSCNCNVSPCGHSWPKWVPGESLCRITRKCPSCSIFSKDVAYADKSACVRVRTSLCVCVRARVSSKLVSIISFS